MKPCCVENRGEPETPNPEKPDLVVRVCAVCGAKHYELSVDQIDLNLTGADI